MLLVAVVVLSAAAIADCWCLRLGARARFVLEAFGENVVLAMTLMFVCIVRRSTAGRGWSRMDGPARVLE